MVGHMLESKMQTYTYFFLNLHDTLTYSLLTFASKTAI